VKKTTINTLSRQFPGFQKSRRRLLQALPLLALAPSVLAQAVAPVAVRKLHSFTIRVSDVARSVKFYQDLFGAPIQARQGDTVLLRIGDGPRFFALKPARAGEQPGFAHIGLSVANFNLDRVRDQLTAFAVSRSAAPKPGQAALEMALRSWVIERDDNRELYFADAEGVVYRLMPENYCGGSGAMGAVCSAVEAAPAPGLFQLEDLSHFTIFQANRSRANEFYTRAFGKQYQAFQGPGAPVIGVGDGLQFLMYVGGDAAGTPTAPGRIDHCCFSMHDFNVERVLAQLTDYGLEPRQDPADTQPLMHWISMRMPNRGGAEGGTPELYFSDPDGIRVQLQDPGYCGGGGFLGDSCPPL
jgi:catechol 2,3-dioxygenase-like lactoylglutathione lyase family enzyme